MISEFSSIGSFKANASVSTRPQKMHIWGEICFEGAFLILSLINFYKICFLQKLKKNLMKGKKQKIKLLLQNKIWANFSLWFTEQQINKRALTISKSIFSSYTKGRIVEEKIPKYFQKNLLKHDLNERGVEKMRVLINFLAKKTTFTLPNRLAINLA